MTTSSSTLPVSSSPTLAEILKAIDGYFDCRLSEAEERLLYQWLSETTYTDPAIDEARAVIGITHLNRTTATGSTTSKRKGRTKSLLLPVYTTVAAAVAILLLVVPLFPTFGADSTCIAYAEGKMIVDENEVLALLQSQMTDFDTQLSAQSDEFIDQLSDLPPVMDSNNDISDLFI